MGHAGPSNERLKDEMLTWLEVQGRSVTDFGLTGSAPGPWLAHVGGEGPTQHYRVYQQADEGFAYELVTPGQLECGYHSCRQPN